MTSLLHVHMYMYMYSIFRLGYSYMYMNEVIKSPELNVVCYKMHVHMYASSSMQILFGIRLEDREKHVTDISIWEHI